MSRYFQRFYASDPMIEIPEEAAHQGGTYVEEIESPVRLFRCVFRGELTALVYPDWTDPTTPLADARRRNEGVPVQVYSPVERDPDGKHRWRTWYADAAGVVEKILEPEFDAEGRYLREFYRGPDGELRSYQEYVYDRYDELFEVVTHAPDGRVINREHS